MKMLNRKFVASRSSILRLFSNLCSSRISADAKGPLSLLFNKGNPNLEIFSSSNTLFNGNGVEEDVIRKFHFPIQDPPLCGGTHHEGLVRIYSDCQNVSLLNPPQIKHNTKLVPPLLVSGPCNGLVCVYSDWQQVFLLNPVTGHIKAYTFPRWKNFHFAALHFLGFGFDSKTNDFKIVRSITFDYWDHLIHHRKLAYKGKEVHCIETLSLNAAMERREIKVVGEIRSIRPSHSCSSSFPSVDGVCYWSAKNSYDSKMQILSFDFADEVFDLFTLPPCDYLMDTEDCFMCIFNGLPAAIRYDAANFEDKVFEVWVKREETWVKEMSIGPISHVIKPLCFFNNNHGLILLGLEYQLLLYDFLTKEMSKLDIQIPRATSTIQVVDLKESC